MSGDNATILNAANIPLDKMTGTIPNMGIALLDWFQFLTFTKIVKTTVAYQLVETPTNISFWGLITPVYGRYLHIQEKGERKWNRIQVFAQAGPTDSMLDLNPDDVILYDGIQYRVVVKKNYEIYGYVHFELTQDYTRSGPNP